MLDQKAINVKSDLLRVITSEQKTKLPLEFLHYVRSIGLLDKEYCEHALDHFTSDYMEKSSARIALEEATVNCVNRYIVNVDIFCTLLRKYLIIFHFADSDFYKFLKLDEQRHVNPFTKLCAACVLNPKKLKTSLLPAPIIRQIDLELDTPFIKQFNNMYNKLYNLYGEENLVKYLD